MELVAEKKYKQTEVGLIPEDWRVKELSFLTTLVTNGFVGSIKSEYTNHEKGILYIQGYNVEENSFNFNGIKRVTYAFHEKHLKSCLKEGDLLTIQTGDIGITTVVTKELEGSNCHALIISRFKKHIADPNFYSYYFNFSEGRKRLKEIETGSTMKHINVGDIIRLHLPVPPLKEQTTIATVLSDTDALIQSLEKLIAKKRNIKQGAMQELLKPKQGWEVKKLGDVAPLQRGFDLPNLRLVKGKFPVVYSNGISNYHNQYLINAPGVVTGRSGTIGKVNFLETNFWPHNTTLWVTNFYKNDPRFIYYLFIFLKFEKFGTGSGVPTLNRNDLHSIIISIPDVPEQRRISMILSDMDFDILSIESKLEKCKKIKQGMMQQLLTGKIRLV